ncbi:MAG TPA: hypothetical protein VF169_17460 [Albitalea sp.]|uniref:hypothetical protein n=1 Tax=Piscinibacter sp. TaxID=1903157 RepID=UPI002ED428F6
MKTTTVDKLIWILMYGGLLGVGLGLSVQRSDEVLGWSLAVIGGVVASLGAVLVAVRARMKDSP